MHSLVHKMFGNPGPRKLTKIDWLSVNVALQNPMMFFTLDNQQLVVQFLHLQFETSMEQFINYIERKKQPIVNIAQQLLDQLNSEKTRRLPTKKFSLSSKPVYKIQRNLGIHQKGFSPCDNKVSPTYLLSLLLFNVYITLK